MAEPVNLIQKWSKELEAVRGINLFDTNAELAWLAEKASKATRVLEMGSYHGTSAMVMFLANPEIEMMCLDTWDDEGSLEIFKKNLRPQIESGKLTFVQGPTFSGFDKVWEYGFVPDFTFIDASHLYDDVKGDIEETLKVQGSGVIAGHDFRHNLPEDGVTRAAREAFGDKLEFPADSIWSVVLPI